MTQVVNLLRSGRRQRDLLLGGLRLEARRLRDEVSRLALARRPRSTPRMRGVLGWVFGAYRWMRKLPTSVLRVLARVAHRT